MAGNKATKTTSGNPFADFAVINSRLTGGRSKPKTSGSTTPKAAPHRSTPVENNETSRSGIIFLNKTTLLTNSERGRALAAGGRRAPWHPTVGSAYIAGSYTPRGVKPLRPADGALPLRATGSASRPAGRPAVKTPKVPTPDSSLGHQPRQKVPDFILAMGLTMTYGGERQVNGGQTLDANYFTDADQL